MEISCAQMFKYIQKQSLPYHPHNHLIPCTPTLTHAEEKSRRNEKRDGFTRLCLCDLRRMFTSRKRKMKDINNKECNMKTTCCFRMCHFLLIMDTKLSE